jgi:hypothetical protein
MNTSASCVKDITDHSIWEEWITQKWYENNYLEIILN